MQGGAAGRATDGIENMQRIWKSALGSALHSGDLTKKKNAGWERTLTLEVYWIFKNMIYYYHPIYNGQHKREREWVNIKHKPNIHGKL